jgi:hypothetical protein
MVASAGCATPPPVLHASPHEPEVVLQVWYETKKPFQNMVQYSLRFDDPDPRCRWTCEGTSREGRIRCPWPNDCNKAAVDAEVRVLANWLHCSYFFNFETYVRPSWLNGEYHPLSATIPCFGPQRAEPVP